MRWQVYEDEVVYVKNQRVRLHRTGDKMKTVPVPSTQSPYAPTAEFTGASLAKPDSCTA